MRFLLTHIALLASAFFPDNHIRTPVQGSHGNTTKPAEGESVRASAFFPFKYNQANGCNALYSPISVYMSREPPSKKDIQDDGKLSSGSYIFHIGDWVVSNYGLGGEAKPPPKSLEMYVISDMANKTDLYLTVVETSWGCPPTGATEYGMEITRVVYTTS